MESNKPHKIIIVSDDYDYMSDNTLSILKNSFGDEFTIMTLSEARDKNIPCPLMLETGVLYIVPQEIITFRNTNPFGIVPDVFIEDVVKNKKTYESLYARFDKMRRKNKRKRN